VGKHGTPQKEDMGMATQVTQMIEMEGGQRVLPPWATTLLGLGPKLLPWIGIVTIAWLSLWVAPQAVPLKSTEVNFLQLFSSLVFMALVLERALEVFINTWRGPRAALYTLAIKEKLGRIEELKQGGPDAATQLSQARASLKRLKHKRLCYRCQTQQLALGVGMVLGILISAVGIHTLQALVEPSVLGHLGNSQARALHLIDVLLTGGLIAGGSEGLHKMALVFTTFMETTAKRASAAAETKDALGSRS
jgi:hypothetical protein